jgi:hypothetical protein
MLPAFSTPNVRVLLAAHAPAMAKAERVSMAFAV